MAKCKDTKQFSPDILVYPSAVQSLETTSSTTSTTISVRWEPPDVPGELTPITYMFLCILPEDACQLIPGYKPNTKVSKNLNFK